MTPTTSKQSETSALVAALVAQTWKASGGRPEHDLWRPLDLAGAAALLVNDEVGAGASPMMAIHVAGAARVYIEGFLPWEWALTDAGAWDERALAWRHGTETRLDFLWSEAWDRQLPPTPHFAGAGAPVRLCHLTCPGASREYGGTGHGSGSAELVEVMA